ncbi:13926_t:CDS:2, partial [Entrophospora sp. SA101]
NRDERIEKKDARIETLEKQVEKLMNAQLEHLSTHSHIEQEIIEKAMNLFYDVKAERISRAGNTDIEYLYIISVKMIGKSLIAIRDIQGENIVALTSFSLAELINQLIISRQRELSFKGIHEIINGNYGNDISEKVYNLTF